MDRKGNRLVDLEHSLPELRLSCASSADGVKFHVMSF